MFQSKNPFLDGWTQVNVHNNKSVTCLIDRIKWNDWLTSLQMVREREIIGYCAVPAESSRFMQDISGERHISIHWNIQTHSTPPLIASHQADFCEPNQYKFCEDKNCWSSQHNMCKLSYQHWSTVFFVVGPNFTVTIKEEVDGTSKISL